MSQAAPFIRKGPAFYLRYVYPQYPKYGKYEKRHVSYFPSRAKSWLNRLPWVHMNKSEYEL